MSEGLGRRDLVRATAFGLAAGIAGSTVPRPSDPSPTETGTAPGVPPTDSRADEGSGDRGVAPPVSGLLLDLSGDPVEDASVRAVIPGAGTVAETSTDGSGQFGLDTAGRPAWMQITAGGYHDRTVAVAPEGSPTVELTPIDGTVSIRFCGDVMFGRRFYGASGGRSPRVSIDPSTRLADHRAILRPVAPLLRCGDITSVNLETPLTTTDWRHPEKTFAFASHPVAARAMADAGIAYAALGNNHAFDALVPGLEDTFAALDSAGIAHSGAGRSSDEAWRPAIVRRRDIAVGFLSCTTVVEPQHDLDLSADRGAARTHTITRPTGDGEASITFRGDVGAAEARADRLRRRVAETAGRAEVTAVQVHGGYDYRPRPIARIRTLAGAAIEAGADVVVCHHPHVTGGLEIRDGSVIAWSLGNFVFDQTLWQTFPSYVLTVHVGRDGLERAYIDPVLLDGYVPTGVVGSAREGQLWRTAGLSTEAFAVGRHALQFVHGRTPVTATAERAFEGDRIYARTAGWPRAVIEGDDAIEFGRDRLFAGAFEDSTVSDHRQLPPLWAVPGDTTRGGAVESVGDGGVRLTRQATHDEPAVLGPVSHIPVSGPLTLTWAYRAGAVENGGASVRVTWYGGRDGPAVGHRRIDLERTGDGSRRDREDLVPPRAASHVVVSLHLRPPPTGGRALEVEDLRLIEWDVGATGGREYDHLRVDGAATVEFASTAGPRRSPEISWTELGD